MKILQLKSRAAAFGLAAALITGAAQAAVLTNGDFDQPGGDDIRTYLDGSNLPGWTYVSNGGQDIYESSNADGVPTIDGGHYLSFGHNGSVGGAISQSFLTTAGATYNLSYLVGQQQGEDVGQILRATIDLGASSWSVDNAISGLGFTSGLGLSFVGDGGMATLTFMDATASGGGGNANIMLDNAFISVSGGGGPAAVPEPQIWAMMIVGFGIAGTSLRRRRAATIPA